MNKKSSLEKTKVSGKEYNKVNSKNTSSKENKKKQENKNNDLNNLSICIIASENFKKATINAIIEESKKYFSKVLFVTINKLQIQTSERGVGLFYKGKNVLEYDVVYPRFSSTSFFIGEAVLKAIESSNAYCPVNLKTYQVSNHKFYTSQLLSNEGVPGIISTLSISPEYSMLLTEKETGYPLVLKLISGFAGKGVVLVKDKGQLKSILDTVHLFEEFISTQKFAKSKNSGTDVRCYIIGCYVFAVKRTSAKGDWRSNLSRGGTANLVNPSPEMLDAALKSARLLGADICAVDMMDNNGKWVVIESNFMPGPFMKFLDKMIVQEWIKFIHKQVIEKKMISKKESNK